MKKETNGVADAGSRLCG